MSNKEVIVRTTFPVVTFAVFTMFILKLTGVFTGSWLWVISPIFIYPLIMLLCLMLWAVIVGTFLLILGYLGK